MSEFVIKIMFQPFSLFFFYTGVRKLMVVAAATAGVKSQDNESLVVSNNTRMHISVALAKMVDSFGLVLILTILRSQWLVFCLYGIFERDY